MPFVEDPIGSGLYILVGALPSDGNGWHTTDSARDAWNPSISDPQLADLLEIAQEVCEAYAPAGEAVGARFRQAQLLHARETYNAAKVAPSGGFDGDSFGYQPHPLSWKIKGLLRPQSGVPVVA